MKRSKKIDLTRMRKGIVNVSNSGTSTMTLVAATSTVLLQACSPSATYQDAEIFRTVAECETKHPEFVHNECEQAYKMALKESFTSGPKFSTEKDCEAEFGYASCFHYKSEDEDDIDDLEDVFELAVNELGLSGDANWFMPVLGGFAVGSMFSSNVKQCPIGYYRTGWGCQASSAVYRYAGGGNFNSNPGWYSTGGQYYGNGYKRSVKVKKTSFKPKPKVTRTIDRGGFGSKVKAKSWSSSKTFSKSSRSWGG